METLISVGYLFLLLLLLFILHYSHSELKNLVFSGISLIILTSQWWG